MLRIELKQEEDGRCIAEIPYLAGVMAYGAKPEEVRAKGEALALRTLAALTVHSSGRASLTLCLRSMILKKSAPKCERVSHVILGSLPAIYNNRFADGSDIRGELGHVVRRNHSSRDTRP